MYKLHCRSPLFAFTVHLSKNCQYLTFLQASQGRLGAAGSLQLAARQGSSMGQEREWEDLELPLAWHASDRQKVRTFSTASLQCVTFRSEEGAPSAAFPIRS